MIRVRPIDICKPRARIDEDATGSHVRLCGPYSQRS
jgi:hypothetical protein